MIGVGSNIISVDRGPDSTPSERFRTMRRCATPSRAAVVFDSFAKTPGNAWHRSYFLPLNRSVQIQQIIGLLCERFGEALPAGTGSFAFSFPSAAQLAKRSESELRACKMGFRAPYLLETARRIANTELDLGRLYQMPTESARAELLSLPGVGRKIADCVLLFAYGFQDAFPIDVWVTKALRQLYYPNKRTRAKRLHRFAATHFGPNAGYAQQYLFHHMRTKHPKPVKSERIKK